MPSVLTESRRQINIRPVVKTKAVSFREIEDAHRKDRASDTRALRSGKVTARELQEANSFIPVGATMRISNLSAYLKNRSAR